VEETSTYNDKLSVFGAQMVGTWFPELTDLTISFELLGPSPALPTSGFECVNLRRL